ncbi:GlxA family transcriptional regulator [Leucobacter sp. HY1910]
MTVVGILLGPGRRAFDIEVAREVFDDRSDRGVPSAELRLLADSEVTDLNRFTSIRRTHSLTTVTELDLLVVPGSEEPLARPSPQEVTAVANAEQSGVIVAALCTGAFTLAHTGVLAGRTATTHWRFAEELAAQFPEIDVRPRDLYYGDGKIWTSAGVTAGIDLLLHLLRQQWGATAAEMVARSMVTPAFRPGTQAQFAKLRTPLSSSPTVEQLHRAVTADLGRHWQTKDFAEICSMSSRTFYRWFSEHLRTTPNAWLNDLRVREAQRLLEQGHLSVSAVSHAVGYASDDLLRKHFFVRLGTTPTAHSRSFSQKRRV